MKNITSIQNQEIKDIVKLGDSKGRAEQQRFIVEGLRAVKTFMDYGYQPVQVYILDSHIQQAEKIIRPDVITIVDQAVMNKMTRATTPSGILAVFPIPPQPSPEQLDSGIVLAQISDPGNMGTLIRTCAAMGKSSVVVINGADVWSPKVVQASAGTLALVTVFNWLWEELIKHKKQIPLYALVVTGGVTFQNSIEGQSLLIIGSEAHGLPEQWIQQSDERITLSMPGGTESLNAGIAGSIAMYIAWNA